jgi:hypothetical protein
VSPTEIRSIYSPEELVKLTRVLAEALERITEGQTEIDEAEMREIRLLLGTVIFNCYNAGLTDFESLKSIVLNRAKHHGLF